jgi:hypothetical protein
MHERGTTAVRRTRVVAIAAALAMLGTSGVLAATPRSGAPIATVTCDSAIMIDPPPLPGPQDRVIFERVWVAGRDRVAAPDTHPSGAAPFVFFAKTGIGIRSGSTALVEVTTSWRNRVAIDWGESGNASRIRFPPCRNGHKWVVYAGGFDFRDKKGGCVPLRVVVGSRSKIVRFSVGRRC